MRSSVFAVVLAMLLTPLMASSASLGEAAKKEKARREKNKEAGVTAVRVITQDDVQTNASPMDASGSYTTSESEPRGEATAPSARSGPSKDELMWRSRATAARERLEAARKRLANTPSRTWRTDVSRRGGNGTGGIVVEDNTGYAGAQASVKAAQKALDDIEDEARRKGVLPGWLR
jgi:hypothetical protein